MFVFVWIEELGNVEFSQDDESLRRWKEQLLGSVDIAGVGGLLNSPLFSFSFHSFLFFFFNLVISDGPTTNKSY